jgi:ribose transport system substrate-binding protein
MALLGETGKADATFTYHFVAPDGIQSATGSPRARSSRKKIVLETNRVDASDINAFLGTDF